MLISCGLCCLVFAVSVPIFTPPTDAEFFRVWDFFLCGESFGTWKTPWRPRRTTPEKELVCTVVVKVFDIWSRLLHCSCRTRHVSIFGHYLCCLGRFASGADYGRGPPPRCSFHFLEIRFYVFEFRTQDLRC